MAITTVSLDNLNAWLESQPENTVTTPYEIFIDGIDLDDIKPTLRNILQANPTKYVDLSSTFINTLDHPDLSEILTNCNTLVKGITISGHYYDITRAFYGCSNLREVVIDVDDDYPEIIMTSAFEGCSSLQRVFLTSSSESNPPDRCAIIKANNAFKNCVSLLYPPFITCGTDAVASQNSEYYGTFCNCQSLLYKPVLLSANTDSDTFYNVQTQLFCEEEQFVREYTDLNAAFSAVITTNALSGNPETTINFNDIINYIQIGSLSNWLSLQQNNTTLTPYKIFIAKLNVGNVFDIKNAISSNPTKYVDLTPTTLPSTGNMSAIFAGCTSLVYAPDIPVGVENLTNGFLGCSNLKKIPNLPNVQHFPLEINGCFSNCISLTEIISSDIPTTVISMDGAFNGCTGLVSVKITPRELTTMAGTFMNCSNLEEADVLWDGLQNIEYLFMGCSKLKSIEAIYSSITNMFRTFEDCSNLETIERFEVPLETLKNNSNFQRAFFNCTKLNQIGYFKFQKANEWHVFYFKKNSYSGQLDGSVYTKLPNSISTQTVENISYGNSTKVMLPVLTDELWFPDSILTDQEVDDLIRDMLNNRYGVFNKVTIPPDQKSFVLWAEEDENHQTHVISNILNGGGGGADIDVYDTVQQMTADLPNKNVGDFVATEDGTLFEPVDAVTSGDMNPVTSNAVAEALENVATEIPVYPSLTAAEADLSNLQEGQIIGTEQGGREGVQIKVADYVWSGTMSSVYEQKQIPLSSFASDIDPDKVIGFTVLYWSGFHPIASADWYDTSGLACALTCLTTGTGYARVRCAYFV